MAVIESANAQEAKEMGVACPGLVDKYLSSRGISQTEFVEVKQGGWLYTVHARCSGTLGVWIGSRRQVKAVGASLVGEKGELEGNRTMEHEITELEKGSKWVTVEIRGRSEVTFQLD